MFVLLMMKPLKLGYKLTHS